MIMLVFIAMFFCRCSVLSDVFMMIRMHEKWHKKEHFREQNLKTNLYTLKKIDLCAKPTDLHQMIFFRKMDTGGGNWCMFWKIITFSNFLRRRRKIRFYEYKVLSKITFHIPFHESISSIFVSWIMFLWMLSRTRGQIKCLHFFIYPYHV